MRTFKVTLCFYSYSLSSDSAVSCSIFQVPSNTCKTILSKRSLSQSSAGAQTTNKLPPATKLGRGCTLKNNLTVPKIRLMGLGCTRWFKYDQDKL